MPSPIGHALSGLLVCTLLQKPSRSLWKWQEILPYAVFAVIPDIDFLIFQEGRLLISYDYHHTYSHSLGFGLLVGLVTFGVLWLFRESDRLRPALLAVGLVGLHSFLDLTNATGQAAFPKRLPVFWPFSNQLVSCPLTILPGISVYKSPFHPANLIGGFSELLLFGCLIGGILLLKQSLLKKHS